MKIILIISSLDCGGAQRVITTMANQWVRVGEEVVVLTLDSEKNDFYKLDDRVRRVSLKLIKNSSTIWSALKFNIIRIWHLRKRLKMENPDIAISFIHRMNVLTLLAAIGTVVPVIVSERIDTRQHHIGWIWERLRKLIYHRANAVVVQTNNMKIWAESFLSPNSVYVIPNPAITLKNDDIDPYSAIEFPALFIVAIGRLVPQKGYDMLLDAFARCKNGEWSIVLLGDGPERQRLEKLANKLGISSQVIFMGSVADPQNIMCKAALFVLSSRFEGFPNVLIEAMVCGLPVISFDCPSGPNEIIENGVNGILVEAENVDKLAKAMMFLMNSECKRSELGIRAKEVVVKYSIINIMREWNTLLKAVSNYS